MDPHIWEAALVCLQQPMAAAEKPFRSHRQIRVKLDNCVQCYGNSIMEPGARCGWLAVHAITS